LTVDKVTNVLIISDTNMAKIQKKKNYSTKINYKFNPLTPTSAI